MSLKLHQGCFFGNNLKTWEIGEFILSECLYLPDSKITKHSHSNAYISINLHGSYTETYGGRIRECPTQTVVFHPEGEVHSDHFSEEGGRIFRFEIQSERLDWIRERSNGLSAPVDFRGGHLAWLATKLYKEFRWRDSLSPLVIEGTALEIIAEISRSDSREKRFKHPVWVKKAEELLHARYAENLNFTSIAETLNVHPVYFSRAFRKFYGCSVGEYVRRLRVESASRQLTSSDDSLVTIALNCGFSDQSHFTKTFKNATGMTPARYRATFRAG
ncbi:MAG: helix-turn-helix domain-containing protein [Pyrinomonadaceae bacterium]